MDDIIVINGLPCVPTWEEWYAQANGRKTTGVVGYWLNDAIERMMRLTIPNKIIIFIDKTDDAHVICWFL